MCTDPEKNIKLFCISQKKYLLCSMNSEANCKNEIVANKENERFLLDDFYKKINYDELCVSV